ncbi:MAG: ATP-binding cassette domain-containing protein [Treponema sp.]|nr:ATP-binding cassette domain-containing protein [Treponema sp.]
MLSVKNICVKYSYKTVLKDVSINFEKGKIYALLGQNGAGKSTLAHVICGDIKPTDGKLFIDDEEVSFNNPHKAIQRGIVCVHQHPLLAGSISIFENLKLGQKKFDPEKAQGILNYWLKGIKKNTIVNTLLEDQRFFVSLTGALLRNPGLLIMDEPPFISKDDLHKLSKQGITIILITHNLQEALEKSDEVILLQNGNVLEQKPSTIYTAGEIEQKLFGISTQVKIPSFIKTENITEQEVLEKHIDPKQKAGYIPSDKMYRASNPELTILQLCTAYHPEKNRVEQEAYTSALLQRADVQIKAFEKVKCLSGGMLQRVILEREMMEHPAVLYLFNPTKGLDVESTQTLYSKLKELHNSGTKIILGKEA